MLGIITERSKRLKNIKNDHGKVEQNAGELGITAELPAITARKLGVTTIIDEDLRS